MTKLRLKITLYFFSVLMGVKKAAIFLSAILLRGFFKKMGRFLARFFIFPIYKLYLKTRLQEIDLARFFLNQKIFFALFILSGLFLVASETRTYGASKYIGGNENLLFKYLSSSDSDFIEEETNDVLLPETSIDWPLTLAASVSFDESLKGPTYEIAGFDTNLAMVDLPPILPGIDFGSHREIVRYVVQSGDTLESIAQKFGINVETLAVENKITARATLHLGDVLNVLPTKGISHKVKRGDTLKKIASLYKVEAGKIAEFNSLTSDGDLKVGETIVIPEGKPLATPVVKKTIPQLLPGSATRPQALRIGGSNMLWPTVSRKISQYYTWRHGGIDIVLPKGNPIYASNDGVVEKSGWNSGGYGYMMLINHGNGVKTRYGHASKLFVSAGEEVTKGDVIALVGSTGRSTGAHLHFEVIVNGARVNPFLYVR